MYSSSIKKKLSSAKADVGDYILVKLKDREFKGILMPRASGGEDILVIKMDNGYNIGLLDSKDLSISLLNKMEKKKQEKEKEEQKGDITILGCGGTISSKVEYRTGAVFPVITPKELENAFPSLKKISSIGAKNLFSLLSEDFNSKHWKKIAEAVSDEIKDGRKGLVLMHGTDTMGYTAAALSFMLQNLPVPVILVGAQRSSDRPSSENEMNLLNSVLAARKSDIAEVGVCMHANTNDDFCYLHRGTRVRKMHTSRRDAFKSINSKPLAVLDYRENKIEPLIEYSKRDEKRKLKLESKINENVAMVYSHPNIKPSFIEGLKDYDGVVLVGTGLGHIPSNPFNDKQAKSLFPAVKNLIDSDIPVVMSSQTIYGRLHMSVYTTGRLLNEAGVIGHEADWTPETAFVKLSWVLGRTKKMKEIKKLMMTNIAGEISDRSMIYGGDKEW